MKLKFFAYVFSVLLQLPCVLCSFYRTSQLQRMITKSPSRALLFLFQFHILLFFLFQFQMLLFFPFSVPHVPVFEFHMFLSFFSFLVPDFVFLFARMVPLSFHLSDWSLGVFFAWPILISFFLFSGLCFVFFFCLG